MTDFASRLRARLSASVQPYFEAAPLAALALGISSGFPYAMIGATLTTRLKQDGISKASITAFSLAFLVYNLKFLWAPAVDRLHLPLLGRYGRRRAWLWLSAVLVAAAVAFLGLADPGRLALVAAAAILVGAAGATFDIVIDAYRIELLQPHQLGVGSGMSQYGWRIGSAAAGALALIVAGQAGWGLAYLFCALMFVLPAVGVGLLMGEPARHREPALQAQERGLAAAVLMPLMEFFRRRGAWLVLLFILLHKIGDTLANLTVRLLLDDLGFSNKEIATYDIGFGFVAYLVGIFIGGILYVRLGMKRSVMVSLLLMAVSNLSFAALARIGHSNEFLAFTIGFENLASGIGGVVVVAYLSALCNLSFTATQFALLSAAASVAGRILTGTTAGHLIETLGYMDFYLLTTLAALPGVLLYAWLWRAGLVEQSIVEADVRAGSA